MYHASYSMHRVLYNVYHVSCIIYHISYISIVCSSYIIQKYLHTFVNLAADIPFMFLLLFCTYVNPTSLILFHPQLTSGHDSKQHRVPHHATPGWVTEVTLGLVK